MQICPKCRRIASSGAAFCSLDGAKMVNVECPNCRYVAVSPHEKFCERCGREIEGLFEAALRARDEEVASATNGT